MKNASIEAKRIEYPVFFKSWDVDPYQAFLSLFWANDYGFPNDGRDEMRTPLWIAFDALGISQYWVPAIANPNNVEFYRQMDECIERFIKETSFTKQNEFMWYLFLGGICLGPYFQKDIFDWISKNYRLADNCSLRPELRYEIVRSTTGAVSLLRDRGPMFKWVLDKLIKSPDKNRSLLNWLFRSPENGKYDSKILELLPDMAMSHRRLLYEEYKSHCKFARQYRNLRKDFPECYKRRIQEMSSSFEWGIKEIFFATEYGYMRWSERNKDPEREARFAERANRFMIEYSARCPFPAV